MTETPPAWDVRLAKQLRGGASPFRLEVRFCCAAQRVVLFGPSGAGKTQTLRMIAGITRPDEGHLHIAGNMLADVRHRIWTPPRARRLGYVFQDYALFPHLSVRQNIAFALHGGWRNPRRRSRTERVEHWIERFGLQDVADHLPQHISGGQQQRTALARALVLEPRALLLDEPFSSLDQGLRRRLRDELLELQAAAQLPLLLITHDEDDVRAIAQVVVPLDQGRSGAVQCP